MAVRGSRRYELPLVADPGAAAFVPERCPAGENELRRFEPAPKGALVPGPSANDAAGRIAHGFEPRSVRRVVPAAATMKIDGLLLDLDGTLYLGDEPIDGAVETVRALHERGIVCRYLTNTTRFSRRELAARLRAMGFPVHDEQVFTAALAAAQWLEQQEVQRIATYLPERAREDFSGFGFDPMRPEAIVVGDLGQRWDFRIMNRAFRQLLEGAMLVALQKNRFWRTPRGFELDAGPFVAALEYAVDREAVVVGKPSAAFFELAAASTGIAMESLAVVGDDVDTDIGGAHAAGLRGVLLRTGKFREDRLERSATVPHAILDSIANLPELFA